MTCNICERFPVPTNSFREISFSIDRHGTLFVCSECKQFIEVVAEERSHKYISNTEAMSLYPDVVPQ